MSGPRVTSGINSKQDYRTPPEFMQAVEARYGPIAFDLAAHAGNKQHADYFAPKEFIETLVLGDLRTDDIMALGRSLSLRGAHIDDVTCFTLKALEDNLLACAGAPRTIEYTIPNSDPEARGLDAFAYPWHELKGLLWLNCEFNDCPLWAKRCAEEAAQGANILLLTPASVGANWARDIVMPNASVDILSGRLLFDGKNPFPKDCMLAHFRPSKGRTICTWDWRTGKVHGKWVSL